MRHKWQHHGGVPVGALLGRLFTEELHGAAEQRVGNASVWRRWRRRGGRSDDGGDVLPSTEQHLVRARVSGRPVQYVPLKPQLCAEAVCGAHTQLHGVAAIVRQPRLRLQLIRQFVQCIFTTLWSE